MLPHTVERFGSIGRSAAAARWRLLAALFVAAAVSMPQLVYSQVLYGSLTGNVSDQSGAVVASGAKVQALNVATNVAKNTTTDSRGNYLFSDLLPGTYDVTIEAAGFKTLRQKNVKIVTNAVQRVNAQLELSPVSEVVEVTFKAPALQTDRADVHITQTAKQVNELPVGGTLGRNYQSLMATVPGAVIVRTENSDGEANSTAANPQKSISFSTNGVSGWTNQTRMDGSPVLYPWLPTNTTYVPSAEAIEEVSIVTNSFSADQGLAGGTAVNVVVKSGTNQLHATAWGYDTNSHFTARQVFAPPTQGMPPKNIVAQFGANLGGPVIKDKLFFFANGERSTQRTAPGALNASIAPLELRPNSAGDVVFPTPAQNPTYGAIIYDPASNPDPRLRTPFANNTIPSSRIDQAAKYLLARLPSPTSQGYTNNFVARGAAVYNRTAWDFKVNFAASSKLTMFARYANSPSHINEQYSLGEAGGSPASGGQVGNSDGRTQVFSSGLTYTFSPTLMLDANFGHTHQLFGAQPPDININVGSDPDKLNIPGTNGPASLQAGGMPAFLFAPAPGSQTSYWTNLGNSNNGNPFQFRDNVYTASVNLQKTLNTHLFRMGVEFLNQQINHYQPQGGNFQTVRGSFLFDGLTTELQGTPAPANAQANSWASFLLGLPSGGTSGAGKVDQLTNPNSIYMKSYSAYLQDTWQVTKALTLSLGVRWDAVPFAARPNGKGVNRFDPTDGYVYVGGYGSTPQDTGASGDSMFQPRAGVAYRLNDKTVFRAGFGRSMDPTSFLNFRNAYPTVNAWIMPQIVYDGVSNPYIPQTTLRQGLVNPGGAPDYSSGRLLLPAGTGTTTYPKDLKRGHLDSWNIALQRELASWLTTQVAYVATRAKGQMAFVNINAGAPGLGQGGRTLLLNGLTNATTDLSSFQPYGDTRYDGLQAELKARSNSAQAGIAYTYSKTTNYNDNAGGNGAGAGGPRIQYMQFKDLNKGLAGYNRTHVLAVYWVLDLPFGKGKKMATSGIANTLFGGWQVNGIFSDMTGTPIYVFQNTAPNLQAAGSGQVPDLVGTIATYSDRRVDRTGLPTGADPNQYRFLDPTAYRAVTDARFGNNVRNSQPGPNFWNVDLGLFRNIGLSGRAKLQLRAEALNALNHANFASPGSNGVPGNDMSNTGTFGYLTRTTGVASRTIRFGARLWF